MTKWVIIQCHNGELSCSEPYDCEEDALSEMTMFFVERVLSAKENGLIVKEEVSDDENYVRFCTEKESFMLRVFEVNYHKCFIAHHKNGFIYDSIGQFDTFGEASDTLRNSACKISDEFGFEVEHYFSFSRVFDFGYNAEYRIFVPSGLIHV